MKVVRIRLRSGAAKIAVLAPYPSLPAWWHDTKAAGHVVGENWCCPFDAIELAELADMQEAPQEPDVQRVPGGLGNQGPMVPWPFRGAPEV